MALILSLLIALLSTTFAVSAQNNAARPLVTKPTDATSYCEKVMNSEYRTSEALVRDRGRL